MLPLTHENISAEVATLARKFNTAIDEIASRLIATYDLKFKQEVDHLNSPLLRWLDFRLRYVDPQPREIVFSDRFPTQNLPLDTKDGLKHLVGLFKIGADVNPYQGRGLILRHDFSGQRRESRTDLLWADWNILHFHLTAKPISENQFFSKPADYLAFCIVGGSMVAFIDVLPHSGSEGFANPELIETIYRNWPTYLDRFELKGVISACAENSMQDIHNLRANGVSYIVTLGGKSYMGPGMGISTASTPTKVTLANNRIRKFVSELAKIVCAPDSPFHMETRKLGIDVPNFNLAITPRGLAVYEEVSTGAFLLAKVDRDIEDTFLDELCNLVVPVWAVEQLTQLP